jgi:hypothetical protein
MIRRIKTKTEIEKAQKRNQTILGGVLILLLVGSMFLVFTAGDENEKNKVTEKGIDFFNTGNGWGVKLDKEIFYFTFLPSELEDVKVSGLFSLGDYVDTTLYYNNFNEGTAKILGNLDRYIQRKNEACENQQECEGRLSNPPIKNCDDNFIIFKEGDDTSVVKEGGCVYITGDFIKGADAFLYKVLNI